MRMDGVSRRSLLMGLGTAAISAYAAPRALGLSVKAPRACLDSESVEAVQVSTQVPEPLFQVSADGHAVQMHAFGGGFFGVFEVAEPMEIEIRAELDIRWVDIRPRSAGIVPVISPDHSCVRFQMKTPVPLTLEFNGQVEEGVIHLFTNPPEKNPPRPGDPNVRYFGPGVHEAGIMEIMEGETFYLALGAWVKGAIRSYGTKNIAIRGRGILDASSLPQKGDPALRAPGRLGTPPPAIYGGGGRNVIYLEKTEGATIEGITLLNTPDKPEWTLYLRSAHGTHIDGVRILSWSKQFENDGIDIVSSSDTLVENTFIRSNDDCVAVKNLDDIDQSNITVRRSVIWNMHGGNGLEIGFENRNHTTRNVLFQDIDIIHSDHDAAISIHNADAGTIEDVTYDNIRVEDAPHELINFSVVCGIYGRDKPMPEQIRNWSDPGGAWEGVLRVPASERAEIAKNRGVIRNIRVTNLHVVEGALPFSIISGFAKDRAVENVVIEDMEYQGKRIRSATEGRFSIENAPGFTIRNDRG